ncbi:MAG: hypothetical protein ACKVZ0_14230 [Gemmatimonadales bacterium]
MAVDIAAVVGTLQPMINWWRARFDAVAPPTRSRLAIGLILAAAAFHVALAWQARNPGIMVGQDDAQYLILGQSIRAGGYHETFRVDRPVHAIYPPAYPAMLALWGLLVGDRYDGLVVLSLLFGGASVAVLGLTLRRITAPALAVAASWLLAVNGDLIRFTGAISSEAPYLFASVASLALLARPASRQTLLAAGALAILAGLTRVVGVTLIGAIGLHWLLERRFRAVGWLALGAAVTVGGWLLWTALAPEQFEGVSYLHDLTAGVQPSDGITPLSKRPFVNGVYYLKRFAWAVGVPTVEGTTIDNAVAGLGLTIAGLVGLAILIRRWRPAGLYAVGYLAMLGVWTWVVERYLMPVESFLIPAVVLGAGAVAARVRPAGLVPVGVGVAALLGLTAAGRAAEAATRWSGCDRGGRMPPPACLTPDQADFFEALRHLEASTPPDAVVLAAKYVTAHYYTRRPTVSLRGALARDSTTLIRFLRDQGVSRVLLGRLLFLEGNELGPSLRPVCRDLIVERSFGRATHLFRLAEPGPSTATSPDACAIIDDYLRLTAGDDFGEFVPRLLDRRGSSAPRPSR